MKLRTISLRWTALACFLSAAFSATAQTNFASTSSRLAAGPLCLSTAFSNAVLHAAAGLANQVVPPITVGPGGAQGMAGLVGPLDNLPGCTLPPAGLVGWWQAEGNANDVLGQHNGTLHGGVAFVSGEVGYGFSFNGSSGYVGVDDSGSLELTSALTIECWVRRSNLANEDYLINKGGDYTWGALNYGLTLNSSLWGSALTFTFANGYRGSVSIADYNWHHVAVVAINGQTDPSFYVDGMAQPVTGRGGAGTINLYLSHKPLQIGAQVDPDSGWNYYSSATLDEVSLYNTALTGPQIQAIYSAGSAGKCPAPVILTQPQSQRVVVGTDVNLSVEAAGVGNLSYQWFFNGNALAGATASMLALPNVQLADSGTYAVVVSNPDGSATSDNAVLTVYEASCVMPPDGLVGWWAAEGNAYDALCQNNGAVHGGVGYVAGEVGQAFSFDGATGYVEVTDPGPLQLTSQLTIECWVRRTSVNSEDYLCNKGGDYTRGALNYGVTLNSSQWGGKLAFTFAGGYRRSVSIADLNWHHIAVVARQGDANPTFYVDGEVKSLTDSGGAATLNLYPSTEPLHIGAQVDHTSGWCYYSSAVIDEVSLYNIVLSTTQIQAIYQAGVAGKCQVTPGIVTPPASQTVAPGGTATFTVVARGTPPLSYQWFANGGAIAEATTASLTLNNVTLFDAGTYKVVVSSVAGCMGAFSASASATLTVSQVAAPLFSPVGGSYSSARNVVVTCATAGATIHYTLTGQEPTESDPTVASGSSVTVDHSLTLKAKAWKAGWTPGATESEGYRIEATPSDQPPTVTVSPPTGTSLLASDDLAILVEASDPDGAVTRIQLFRDGVPVAETTASPLQYTLGQVSAGTYTFVARATDDAGFVTVSSPVAITVNASGPVVSLAGQQPYFTSSPGTLVASVVGVNPGGLSSLTLNGSAVPALTGTFTLSPALAQGANTFTLFATDNQARTGQATATVYLDSVAPVISISAPANNSAFTTTRINVRGTFTESSLKRITVNGVPAFVTSGAWEALSVPLAVGANTITATAEDLAGNTGAATITVTGNSSPVDPVQLTATPVGGFAPLQVTFQVQSSAPGTLQQVLYDFTGDDTTFQTATDLQPITHTYSTSGQYFPVVTLVTSAGRFSSSGGWNAGDPTCLRINVQPQPQQVGAAITVTDPVDLKATADGKLYVLSRSTATILEYDTTTTPPTLIRSKSGVGTTPTGLDVDGTGNVYVAISGDNQVAKFNPTSTSFQLDPSFGTGGVIGSSGSANGQFNAPFDVAVTPDGQQITVSDSGNHRLQSFATASGQFTTSFGQQGSGNGQFNTPKGVVYDGVGYLYVVDSGNNRVVLAYGADFLGTSGSSGNGLGQFQGPVSLGLGTRGIYVADSGNNRVEVFEPLASAQPPPFDARLALANQFTPALSQPTAASACSDLLQEKLYIADTGNNRVLLVQLPADTPEAVWSAMKQRLLAGDVAGAMPYFAANAAEDYRQLYLTFSASELNSMISQIPAISPIFIEGDEAQYYFQQPIEGVTITFPIDFVKENGTWKILEY